MSSFFQSFFGKNENARSAQTAHRKRSLRLEPLEERQMLAVTAIGCFFAAIFTLFAIFTQLFIEK